MRVIPWSHDYRVRCVSCRYSRQFGAARVTALHAMTKHAMIQPGHYVCTLDGITVIDTACHKQVTLGDDPPY